MNKKNKIQLMAQSAGIRSKSTFSVSDTWSDLKKAWKSYKSARLNSDKVKMLEFANKIRKLEYELGSNKSKFPELDLS